MLDETLKKATEDGGLMQEMVETMAVLGPGETEKMLEWYAGMMPQEVSAARREMGVWQVKWMAERRIEENQGLMKEEVMRDGMKRGMFPDGNGPDEILDCGKHVGKTHKQVCMEGYRLLRLGREAGQAWSGEVEPVKMFPSEDERFDREE